MKTIIYKVTNLVNGKIYIGKTTSGLKNRMKAHLCLARKCNGNGIFTRAIHKYGKENFKWEIVDCCLFEDQLSEMEKYYIKEFNCRHPHGYNLTDGGEGNTGYIATDETRKKLSVALKGLNTWSRGIRVSAETLHKMSEARMGAKNPFYGKRHTDETKNKISRRRLGSHHSDDIKKKMSLTRSGIPWSQARRDAENKRDKIKSALRRGKGER
jgi:group I intron endonuclease